MKTNKIHWKWRRLRLNDDSSVDESFLNLWKRTVWVWPKHDSVCKKLSCPPYWYEMWRPKQWESFCIIGRPLSALLLVRWQRSSVTSGGLALTSPPSSRPGNASPGVGWTSTWSELILKVDNVMSAFDKTQEWELTEYLWAWDQALNWWISEDYIVLFEFALLCCQERVSPWRATLQPQNKMPFSLVKLESYKYRR